MKKRMGAIVVEVLEQAGARYVEPVDPRLHASLLLQIGGTKVLRWYAASTAYWESVQVVLDNFFTSAERAEICGRLISRPELRACPEFRAFHTRALAERRLQALIEAAAIASSAIGRPPLAAARRGR